MTTTIFTTPERFGASLQALFRELMEAQAGGVERAMFRAAQAARVEVVKQIGLVEPHPPVNLGQMRDGYEVVRVPGGAVLQNPVEHAVYMEFGTRPHFPPISAMRLWATQKLRGAASIPTGRSKADAVERLARAAQHAIARRGTRPRRFHAKASERFPEFVADALRYELSAIAARSFARAVR